MREGEKEREGERECFKSKVESVKSLCGCFATHECAPALSLSFFNSNTLTLSNSLTQEHTLFLSSESARAIAELPALSEEVRAR